MFKGELLVHIREYQLVNGMELHTKKGICFNAKRWACFRDLLPEISRQVDLMKADQPVDFSKQLGGKYYVTLKSGVKCVNLRRYFVPQNGNKELPTRSGIGLRLGEWSTLLEKIDLLHQEVPDLKSARPCYLSPDHMNQITYLSCMECSPFGLYALE